jgi:hypothetical protein
MRVNLYESFKTNNRLNESNMQILNLVNPKDKQDKLTTKERLFLKSLNLKNLENGEILYTHGKFDHDFKFLKYGQTDNVLFFSRYKTN